MTTLGIIITHLLTAVLCFTAGRYLNSRNYIQKLQDQDYAYQKKVTRLEQTVNKLQRTVRSIEENFHQSDSNGH